MSIIKDKVSGLWKVDVRVGKYGKRYRKICSTKRECIEYIDFLKVKYKEGKPWKAEAADNRRLTELIELWYRAKGCDLEDGEPRKRLLLVIAGILNDPIARELTIKDFNDYKAIKKAGSSTERPIMDKTINNHLGYLRALYNTLIKSKEIRYRNPLEEAEMIKTQQPELAYLTTAQIETLLHHIDQGCINPHVKLIARLCLSTGARWGEVESRQLYHFKDYRVQYSKTKGKRIRTIPVEADLFEEVCAHLKIYKTFSSSLGAFRRALKRSGIHLPKGQASHVLRHTFASHFMMNGGNILVLQKILGHSDIAMTMRYAKFDPEHLKDAARLNPLSSQPSRTKYSKSYNENSVGHFLDTSAKTASAQS